VQAGLRVAQDETSTTFANFPKTENGTISMALKTLTHASTLVLALAAGGLSYVATAQAADSTTTANPNPTVTERATARVGNEVDKAAGANTPITKAELTHAVALSMIDDPAKALSTAQIKNAQGEAVGTVSSVDVMADGKAKAVHADVGGFLGIGGHVVALDADKLVYLKARNLLVTKLSKEEIQALPPEAPAHG
jgi:hypothetical protein